jgi:hypothetical protein
MKIVRLFFAMVVLCFTAQAQYALKTGGQVVPIKNGGGLSKTDLFTGAVFLCIYPIHHFRMRE